MPTFLEKKLAEYEATFSYVLCSWFTSKHIIKVDIEELEKMKGWIARFAKDHEAHILEELAKGLPEEANQEGVNLSILEDTKGVLKGYAGYGWNKCLAEVKKLFNHKQ